MYRKHASSVHTYFYHHVGNIQDAEDLTATAFSKALASFAGYQTARGSRAAWLFGIARNCLRDHWRRARGLERFQPDVLQRLQPDIADRQPSPEMHVLSAERALALGQAIQRLPSDQREALSLRFFGGLQTADVAAVLGKSEGAVRMLLYRAVVKLRERSKQEGWR
jgi:RNA polymerase sigma-70 factor (ECF subfamily)